MIVLGRIPFALGFDGRHHAPAELLVGAGDRLACLAVLIRVLGEDRRAILGADVIALTVELGRVVSGEEDVEQIVVADLIGSEGHADRFGMTGIAAADLAIGRVGDRAAGITALDRFDPDDIEEHRLGAPETSAGEDCDLIGHGTAPWRLPGAEIGALSRLCKTPSGWRARASCQPTRSAPRTPAAARRRCRRGALNTSGPRP